MSNSAYHEYVKELEFIANEYIQDQTGLVLPKSVNEHYAEWEEMTMDPTWQTDPSSSPPSHKLAGHDVRKVNNGHLYCNTCKHGRMVW